MRVGWDQLQSLSFRMTDHNVTIRLIHPRTRALGTVITDILELTRAETMTIDKTLTVNDVINRISKELSLNMPGEDTYLVVSPTAHFEGAILQSTFKFEDCMTIFKLEKV